jgi:hypothetical protein
MMHTPLMTTPAHGWVGGPLVVVVVVVLEVVVLEVVVVVAVVVVVVEAVVVVVVGGLVVVVVVDAVVDVVPDVVVVGAGVVGGSPLMVDGTQRCSTGPKNRFRRNPTCTRKQSSDWLTAPVIGGAVGTHR